MVATAWIITRHHSLCNFIHRKSSFKNVELRGDILGVEVLEFRHEGRSLHNQTVAVVMADRTRAGHEPSRSLKFHNCRAAGHCI